MRESRRADGVKTERFRCILCFDSPCHDGPCEFVGREEFKQRAKVIERDRQ